jgi:hypothetical protein
VMRGFVSCEDGIVFDDLVDDKADDFFVTP